MHSDEIKALQNQCNVMQEMCKRAAQTLELVGLTLVSQQEEIEALKCLVRPFAFPIVAPQPVRDLSIGVDKLHQTPRNDLAI